MNVRILRQREMEWGEKQERFQSQLKNIREIAAQDNEERVSVQRKLESELYESSARLTEALYQI